MNTKYIKKIFNSLDDSYKTSENNGASSLFPLDPKSNCETLGLVTYNLPLAIFSSRLLKVSEGRPPGWSYVGLVSGQF